MSDTRITAFLDQERAFDLALHMLELERVTGAGVGRVVARVISGEFHAADLGAVVRLGLIGGGETPQAAAALVETYVTGRPLTEGHALATQIVMALWAGKSPKIEDAA